MSVTPLRRPLAHTVDALATRFGLARLDVLNLLADADADPAAIVNARPAWPTHALLAAARKRLAGHTNVADHERSDAAAARALDALLAANRAETERLVDAARETLTTLDTIRSDALARPDLSDEQREAIAAHFDGCSAFDELRAMIETDGRSIG